MIRLALLGDPVEHSLSPVIHEAALAAAGIDGRYEARQADTVDLIAAVEEIRRGDLDGANVTMPLKAAALDSADTVALEAVRAGAVNTLVARTGAVAGENTDIGSIGDVWESRSLPDRNPVLVLGAGGAAGAAVVALDGRDLYVSARRDDAAALLLERTGVHGVTVAWGDPVPDAVIVNCTPLGMRGEQLPDLVVGDAAGLLDMAYGPEPTPAVSACRDRMPVADGIDVLVAQAARSFSLWTGVEAPREAMEAAARG